MTFDNGGNFEGGPELIAQPVAEEPFARIRAWRVPLVFLAAIFVMAAIFIFGAAFKIPRTFVRAAAECSFYFCLIFYIWHLHRKYGLNFSTLLGIWPVPWINALWLLIIFPFFICANELNGLRWIHGSTNNNYFYGYDPLLAVVRVGLMVSIGPVVEEILFRGILLHRLSLMLGRNRGIILTSICFGMLHNAPFVSFSFGVIMCLLYIKTGSLVVPIAFHILNNIFATIPGPHSDLSLNPMRPWMFTPAPLLISSVIMACFFYKLWPRKEAVLPYFRDYPKTNAQLSEAI